MLSGALSCKTTTRGFTQSYELVFDSQSRWRRRGNKNMDHLPDNNSRYKDVDYWDERYKTEQSYDWLGSFSKFQHILENHVKKEDSILMLGCGNSSLSGDMYIAGFRSITNIDYSSVCISTMSARHSDCPGMTWHEMDVRQLSFPDASFDVVLEKATLDALMVDEKDPWRLSPKTTCFIHKALTEISRCLKPGGRFVSITFHSPFLRKRLYARTEYNWSIKKFSYDGGFEYFVYVMTKGEKLSPEDAALEKKLLDDAKSPPAKVTTLHTEPDEDFLSNIDL
ncbi:EEF1A lysine methyltransferase 4 isoform X1 [Acanthopagrus latus]|uniref:EEF1A lysine methyltransferase 4 isoform X1 n=2 Tax=Acanthopagrus latus TaxID=8177 RepID=UPI00187BC5B0|nr:EEF1A lysine methyltransferase 4 isoform X1 [Acanthopagrus latus]